MLKQKNTKQKFMTKLETIFRVMYSAVLLFRKQLINAVLTGCFFMFFCGNAFAFPTSTQVCNNLMAECRNQFKTYGCSISGHEGCSLNPHDSSRNFPLFLEAHPYLTTICENYSDNYNLDMTGCLVMCTYAAWWQLSDSEISSEVPNFEAYCVGCTYGEKATLLDYRVGTGSNCYAKCSNCSGGTYQDSYRHMNTSCKVCPAGTESNGSGARSCRECSAGSYAPQGSSYCSMCQEATYSGAGAESCTPCPEPGYSGWGSPSIESCYVGPYDTFEDDTGTYTFTQTCYWTEN